MTDYSLIRTVAPAVEPISLEEARTHLRVDHEDEDAFIGSLITAAREYVESHTHRQLVLATYRLGLPHWPCGDFVKLPRPILAGVTSITYVDTAGSTQTWNSANYSVDTDSLPGRVWLGYGLSWPDVRCGAYPITITYTAGWATAALVPESLKTAIKMILANWYENREATISGTIITPVPMAVESILINWKVPSFP